MFKVSIHDQEQNFTSGQKVVTRKGQIGTVVATYRDGKALIITIDVNGQSRHFGSQFLRAA
jgi:preprotein translocase subunit YajC